MQRMNLAVAVLILIGLCLLPSATLKGQTAAGNVHAPDPDMGMAGRVEGLYISLIAGHPFHAKINAQVTRILPDGTTVSQKYYTLVARDADGRTYREGRDLIAADSDREPPLVRMMIYDPKAGIVMNCTPTNRVCQRLMLNVTTKPAEETVGPSSDGLSVLTSESLGTKQMDGVTVTGTKETRTFKAGAFGNDKPVVVTREIWYSPDLQFNLEVTRMDPRNGTQKFTVSDLKLGDPGPEWFAIPDGYRVMVARTTGQQRRPPLTLTDMLKDHVNGISEDQLEEELKPVEAAVLNYSKAHAAASPKDPQNRTSNLSLAVAEENGTSVDPEHSRLVQNTRQRLSSEVAMMQQAQMPRQAQYAQAEQRLKEMYDDVISSPCISKTSPGDPPSMPISADALRDEEQAWIAMRDAWTAFLNKLFPDGDHNSYAWMLTQERTGDLRRIQNVERNRGCMPQESIAPLIARMVNGKSLEELRTALKPVDDAVNAYVKAHAADSTGRSNENYEARVQQQLFFDLQSLQNNTVPTRDQFEEADLHLNQAYRKVMASPCLSRPIPADPPYAPQSVDGLREEQRAWVSMRDAWTAFLTTLYPANEHGGLGYTLTEQRANELREIQNVERNRGCRSDDDDQ